MFEKIFHLKEHNTNVRTECIAGVTTFMTMAYILAVNPSILSSTGMNPTAVASAGRMTSAASMGIMLPAASSGAIIMPWIIGMVAEHAGIEIGMASNIIPCAGMLLFSVAVKRLKE